MNENNQPTLRSRRAFLRDMASGALGLAAGSLLAGCGGGSSTITGTVGRRLFVSTFTGNTIEQFDASTGAHQRTINTNLGPAGLALGHNNDIFAAMRFADRVERYDLTSGKLIGTIKQTLAPHSVAIGPDGHVYIPNVPSYYSHALGQDTIERFDAVSGASLGTFAQMDMPFSLVWGPDSNLYASTALELGNTHPNSDSIRRFAGTTGSLLNIVVQGDKVPFDMLFMTDGTMLVAEFIDSRITRYDLTTGLAIGQFASVNFPIGMTVGPDGNLYVGSFSDRLGRTKSGTVQRFNLTTGAPLGTFISGLTFGAFLAFA